MNDFSELRASDIEFYKNVSNSKKTRKVPRNVPNSVSKNTNISETYSKHEQVNDGAHNNNINGINHLSRIESVSPSISDTDSDGEKENIYRNAVNNMKENVYESMSTRSRNSDQNSKRSKKKKDTRVDVDDSDNELKEMNAYLNQIKDPIMEKQSALLEMERLRISGFNFTKHYTMQDSLADIQFEIRRIHMFQKEQASLNMMRNGLKLTFNSIEVLNRVAGNKLSLDGWSQEASSDMQQYDPSLSRLYHKYWRRNSSSPEFELGFAILSSMGVYHFKSKFLQTIQRTNPSENTQTTPSEKQSDVKNAHAGEKPAQDIGSFVNNIGNMFGGLGGMVSQVMKNSAEVPKAENNIRKASKETLVIAETSDSDDDSDMNPDIRNIETVDTSRSKKNTPYNDVVLVQGKVDLPYIQLSEINNET